ncbi:hypothetical protein V6N13_053598 [Hibiscus sabdariffa]|uniref:Peptidylprolyl isomerase n=1 Tax=Hibiscus sabdariffa TaxID=183260 RepID=A0ABR2T752_9ROSI
MELFNGAERMHSVRGGDAGALGSPQLLLLSRLPLILGNSRGSSLMSRSSSSMITHEISLMFPLSRRLLFGGVRHGDNHLLSMVAAIKLSCFPLGSRDFESRTLKPFPFGRALNQHGRELQTPVLCLNGRKDKEEMWTRKLSLPIEGDLSNLEPREVVQWFNDFEFRSAIESVDNLNPESKSSKGGELGRAKPEPNDAHSSYESSPCR